jgi:hypothetical protein
MAFRQPFLRHQTPDTSHQELPPFSGKFRSIASLMLPIIQREMSQVSEIATKKDGYATLNQYYIFVVAPSYSWVSSVMRL